MYDTTTPGGAKLSVAVGNLRDALAEIVRLKTSVLAKAYEVGDPPVFTGMVEEFGVANGTVGNQVFGYMDAIALAFGQDQQPGGAAENAVLLLDTFA